MTESFTNALKVQGRTLWALSLREIHGLHGKSKLGYLWQIIKTGFGMMVFWFMRELAGAQAPHGLSVPVFLLMGFVVWYIFSEIISKSMEAVRSNQALLTFPQITTLDLFLSSAIVAWTTEVVIMLLYLLLFSGLGYQFRILDPVTFMFTLLVTGIFALGTGLTLASLAVIFPVIEKLVPMVMRILFFVSGVFFSAAQFASRFSDVLLLNPIMNYIELMRGSFITHSPLLEINQSAFYFLAFFMLGLGLLLERRMRIEVASR